MRGSGGSKQGGDGGEEERHTWIRLIQDIKLFTSKHLTQSEISADVTGRSGFKSQKWEDK